MLLKDIIGELVKFAVEFKPDLAFHFAPEGIKSIDSKKNIVMYGKAHTEIADLEHEFGVSDLKSISKAMKDRTLSHAAFVPRHTLHLEFGDELIDAQVMVDAVLAGSIKVPKFKEEMVKEWVTGELMPESLSLLKHWTATCKGEFQYKNGAEPWTEPFTKGGKMMLKMEEYTFPFLQNVPGNVIQGFEFPSCCLIAVTKAAILSKSYQFKFAPDGACCRVVIDTGNMELDFVIPARRT